jgi:hypothetical protein
MNGWEEGEVGMVTCALVCSVVYFGGGMKH